MGVTKQKQGSVLVSELALLRDKFFNLDGRLNRKPFIIRLLGLYIVTNVLALFFASLLGGLFGSEVVMSGTLIGVYIIGAAAISTLIARRLHDIGYSSALAAIYFVYTATMPFASQYLVENDLTGTLFGKAYQIFFIGVLLFVVCLMLLKGVKGDNRYGKDPLASA